MQPVTLNRVPAEAVTSGHNLTIDNTNKQLVFEASGSVYRLLTMNTIVCVYWGNDRDNDDKRNKPISVVEVDQKTGNQEVWPFRYNMQEVTNHLNTTGAIYLGNIRNHTAAGIAELCKQVSQLPLQ